MFSAYFMNIIMTGFKLQIMQFLVFVSLSFVCVNCFSFFKSISSLTSSQINRTCSKCPLDGLENGTIALGCSGRSIYYECNEGFRLVDGDRKRKCCSDRVWNGKKPRCEEIICPAHNLTNGLVIGSNRNYGSAVLYQCDECYKLEKGDSNRTCGLDGTWEGTLPTCTNVECPPLSITNGAVTGGRTCGESVHYQCNIGHNLVGGTSTRHCDDTGTWNGTAPTCDAVSCSAETLSNGIVITDGLTYGEKVYYSCDRCFYLKNGDSSRWCGADGLWVGTKPSCMIIECAMHDLKNGVATLGSASPFCGLDMLYTCDEGFIMDAPNRRVCQPDGLWDGVLPTCNLITCVVHAIHNGVVKGSDFSYGGTIEYICNECFRLEGGDKNRTCGLDGSWSGTVPSCNVVTCPSHTLENGKVIVITDLKCGSMVTYRCNDGYLLDGGEYLRKCGNDGEWEGVIPNCTYEGDIRLVDGDGTYGRLEVFYDGFWGLVCNDNFGLYDAVVVCRQLNLWVNTSVESPFYTSGGGQGKLMFLDELFCNGTENRLDECPHVGRYQEDCSYTQAVGVYCMNATEDDLDYKQGEIRLVGGDGTYGRVEVFQYGFWGVICDDYFSIEETMVICRQLNLGLSTSKSSLYYDKAGGVGKFMLYDNLQCTGFEESIDECPHVSNNHHNCGPHEAMGVNCMNATVPYIRENQGDLRLVEGRLEIYLFGYWGTICDDKFDDKDASVACRQMKFPGINNSSGKATIKPKPGTGIIFIDELACLGTESTLLDCKGDFGKSNCKHDEDVGILCDDGGMEEA